MNLNKLNCNNYHVCDSENDHWYAQNGLRSLYEYSKISDKTFREICTVLYYKGEITIKDIRDNDNEFLTITLI